MRFDVKIPSENSAGQEAQERIIALAEARQFPESDLFGLRLALEEAIVNAIRHGNLQDPSKFVRIGCEFLPDRVVIEIEDEGAGYHPEDVPDPTADENIEKPSGRGLMLMRAFLTSVRVVGRGNLVILEKLRGS